MYKFLEIFGVHDIIKWYFERSFHKYFIKTHSSSVEYFVWLQNHIKFHVYFNN